MSFSVYPVNSGAFNCDDYRVFINGKEYPADCARVSAVPFNRRWPGHQRGTDQTEIICFLSLETDGKLDIEIISKGRFDPGKLKIRPLGSVENTIADGKTIRFSLPGAGYYSVEPFGRNRAFLILADKPSSLTLKDCPGEVIYFAPGVHHPGLIEMKSDQTLFIDKGALVYATVYAVDAENISIVGRGILDNGENREKILFEANQTEEMADVGNALRANAIQLDFCRNVRIEGITMRDSLCYNIKPVCCENVRIFDIKIIGNWRYNSDGIDMHNSKNVTIENCFIRTFDDCICAKGFDPWLKEEDLHRNGGDYDVFDGLHVRDCTLWNDWGKCLEAGVEMRAKEMKNILFEDCRVIHATHTVLDCGNYDYAAAHDITFRGITVELDDKVPTPVYQEGDEMIYEDNKPDYVPRLCCVEIESHHEYSDKKHGRGTISGVLFENIDVIGDQPIKLRVDGFDAGHRCSHIVFKNIKRNGVLLKKDQLDFKTNEFTDNIEIITE